MSKLAVSQERVGASGDAAAAGSAKASAAMGVLGKVAKVGALALVATGLEAVKMSTTFNHEMLRIRTDAGASTAELARMKQGVLDLAASGASMGQGPMSLAQGLYHLESLGIRGRDALKALALASQESAISGANLEQTTTAMGAAMYTGIKGTGNLTKLMGTLNATVGAGNMRFQDLVEALGTGVLPSAKVAGLSIQDVSAALAVATDSGYKASSAAAQLGTAFHFLYAPTSKATAALESIHLSHNSLARDMHQPRGLLVALTDLKTHLDGLSKVQQAQVLNAILPGGRGRILLTELTMLGRLQGKYNQINKTAGGFTGSVNAQRSDPQTQLKTAAAEGQAALIRLGNVLTPILLPALTAVLHAGIAIVNWLKDGITWLQKHGDAAKALAVFVGVLVGAFVALKVATIASSLAFAVSPIGMIVIGIAALAAGVVYAYNHFKVFRDVVDGVWKWLKGAVVDTIAFVSAHWQLIADILFGPFGWAAGQIISHWNSIVTFVGGLPNRIATAASGLWDGLKQGLAAVILWIEGKINSMIGVYNATIGQVAGSISTIDTAGTAAAAGQINGRNGYTSAASNAASVRRHLAAASKPTVSTRGSGFGTSFQTLKPLNASGGGLVVHAHLHVDGREIARVQHRQTWMSMAAGA